MIQQFVASELKDSICHSDECQIGSFSSEATNYCPRQRNKIRQRAFIQWSNKYKQMVLWKWHSFKFGKNQSYVNFIKCKRITLAGDEIDLNLNRDGTQIKNTKQEKLLGVIIDNNLTWHNQIKK